MVEDGNKRERNYLPNTDSSKIKFESGFNINLNYVENVSKISHPRSAI